MRQSVAEIEIAQIKPESFMNNFSEHKHHG